jgi:hypothetical protein
VLVNIGGLRDHQSAGAGELGNRPRAAHFIHESGSTVV